MARFSEASLLTATEIISRYPRPKSALIPLLHLAQEQDGYVANDAMAHIVQLVGVTPAEVLGNCSFYEMFKGEPVGDYAVNVCTNIAYIDRTTDVTGKMVTVRVSPGGSRQHTQKTTPTAKK